MGWRTSRPATATARTAGTDQLPLLDQVRRRFPLPPRLTTARTFRSDGRVALSWASLPQQSSRAGVPAGAGGVGAERESARGEVRRGVLSRPQQGNLSDVACGAILRH